MPRPRTLLPDGVPDAPRGVCEPFTLGAGRQDTIAVQAPAAGANWTYTVPTTFVVRPRLIRLQLTTSATVANRYLGIDYGDPDGNIIATFPPATVLAASNNNIPYVFGVGLVLGSTQGAIAFSMPLTPMMLRHGYTISSRVQNFQAGDQIAAIRLTLEFIEVPSGVA